MSRCRRDLRACPSQRAASLQDGRPPLACFRAKGPTGDAAGTVVLPTELAGRSLHADGAAQATSGGQHEGHLTLHETSCAVIVHAGDLERVDFSHGRLEPECCENAQSGGCGLHALGPACALTRSVGHISVQPAPQSPFWHGSIRQRSVHAFKQVHLRGLAHFLGGEGQMPRQAIDLFEIRSLAQGRPGGVEDVFEILERCLRAHDVPHKV